MPRKGRICCRSGPIWSIWGQGQSRLNPCIFAGRNTLWGVKWTISQRRRGKAADMALESRRDDGSVSARLGLCVINCTENTRPGAVTDRGEIGGSS